MAVMHSKKSELLALYLITQNNKKSFQLLGLMEPDHFLFDATKSAFQRYIKLMSTKGIQLDWDSLCEDPALDPAHREILQSFDTSSVSSKVNVKNLYTNLENYRLGRAIVNVLNQTHAKFADKFDAVQIADEMADGLLKARTKSNEQKVFHIGNGNNTAEIVKNILDQDAKLPVIPTGFANYDSVFSGLPDCGVVVLAATSSSGKSLVANQLALNIQDQGRDVLKVSLEMPIEQELIRILSNQLKIPISRIKNKKLTKDEVLKVAKGYKKLVKKSKFLDNRLSVISPSDDMSMRQVLMQAKPYDYDVIIIDYISLLAEEPGVEMWKHLSNIARQAKQYTMTNKCLIILLAQLDEDSNKIRYSRAIKEHCDVMWAWNVTDADRENSRLPINQTKGRNDGILSFELEADFECMRVFSNNPIQSDDSHESDGTSPVTDILG